MSEIVKLGVERKIHKLIKEIVAEELEMKYPEIAERVREAVDFIIDRCRDPIEEGDVKECELCVDREVAKFKRELRARISGYIK